LLNRKRKEIKEENLFDNDVVPKEIDIHLKLYGKHAWEVNYGDRCPLCDKPIDEYGFCTCGSGGS
jgi:hypothetical protein